MTTEETGPDFAAPPGPTLAEEEGWEWAIVEIFGHRRHAGRIREEERFGARMLRIDVPRAGADGAIAWVSHFYGGAAIFSLALTDAATVERVNRIGPEPGRLSYRSPERFDDPDFAEEAAEAWDERSGGGIGEDAL